MYLLFLLFAKESVDNNMMNQYFKIFDNKKDIEI